MTTNVFGTMPGAVVGSGLDAGVPAHFGDPAGEQAALAAGLGVTDLSHLDVVTVTGADRLSYLTTLSTQVVADLQPGQSAEALLLDPQGRISFWLAVTDDGERTYLITEAGRGTDLVAFLEKMKFMLRVEAALATSDFAVLGLIEPISEASPAAESNVSGSQDYLDLSDLSPVTVWHDPWPTVNPNGTSYCAVEPEKHPGRTRRRTLVVVPRTQAEAAGKQALQLLGDRAPQTLPGGWSVPETRPAGMLAWEALRLADWRPRWGREVDHKTLPHELDWLRTAVHLHKGCYCGQEAVARLINLGKPPRRLVQLDLDGSEGLLPQPGDRVLAGARAVGVVTSVATHFEDGPVALALLRRATPEGPVTVEVTQTPDSPEVEDVTRAAESETESEAAEAGMQAAQASEKEMEAGNEVATREVIGTVSAGVRPIVRPDGRCDHTPEQRPGQELRGLKLGN